MKTYTVTKTFTGTALRHLLGEAANGSSYWARIDQGDFGLEIWERERDTGAERNPDFVADTDRLAHGLQLLANSPKLQKVWGNVCGESTWDRWDADIVLQLTVFGEVKYG